MRRIRGQVQKHCFLQFLSLVEAPNAPDPWAGVKTLCLYIFLSSDKSSGGWGAAINSFGRTPGG